MKETWIQSHWRPMIAVAYVAVIIFDFIVGPIFWSVIQVYGQGNVTILWEPLTLKSAGIFHATVSAILGISAFTRGQEKVARLNVETIGQPSVPDILNQPINSGRIDRIG